MDLSRMTLAEHLGIASPVPGSVPKIGEQRIRQLLAKAERLIRQQRPAQALTLLQAPGSPPAAWPLLWHPPWYLLAGWAMTQQQQPQEARVLLEQGLEVLKYLLRRPSAAKHFFLYEWREWLRCFLGISFCGSNQPVQALFCHQQALRGIAEAAIQDRELAMLIYKGLGDAALALGAYHEALTFFRLAKQRGHDVYDPHTHGLIEQGLGLAYKFQGAYAQAKQAFAQALTIFDQLDAKPLASQLRSLLGQVMIWQHHYDEAETTLRQALGAAQRTGDARTRGIALRNMAALHVARGKPERAIRTIQDGLAILQELGDRPIVGQLYITLARAYEAQHNLAAAETALATAVATLNQTQNYGLLCTAHERYGKFLADQGRFQEAYEQLKAAPRRRLACYQCSHIHECLREMASSCYFGDAPTCGHQVTKASWHAEARSIDQSPEEALPDPAKTIQTPAKKSASKVSNLR